jgi:hypothetical protein
LKYIRKLCEVERELADRFATEDDAGRQEYRSAQTAAAREEFHAWLIAQRALPKSPTEMFGRVALFVLIGGFGCCVVTKSGMPLLIVIAVLWMLLRFTRRLERH